MMQCARCAGGTLTCKIAITGNIAIGSNSESVLLGNRGAAKCWKIHGWTGSCGPVSHVHVWEMVLSQLERPNR